MDLGQVHREYLDTAARRLDRFVKLVDVALRDLPESMREEAIAQFVEKETCLLPLEPDPNRRAYLLSAADYYDKVMARRGVGSAMLTPQNSRNLTALFDWLDDESKLGYFVECRQIYDDEHPPANVAENPIIRHTAQIDRVIDDNIERKLAEAAILHRLEESMNADDPPPPDEGPTP